MRFPVAGKDIELEIFTTRADTIFGVTYMVLAPESAYVEMLTTPEQKEAVEAYLNEVNALPIYIQDLADLVAVRKGLEGLTFYPIYVLDLSTLHFA